LSELKSKIQKRIQFTYKNIFTFKMPRSDRSGEYWTDSEEMMMLKHLHNGMSMKEVGNELKRSYTAVWTRLRQVAYELWREDIYIENIAAVTTLSEKQVKLAIESKMKKPLKV